LLACLLDLKADMQAGLHASKPILIWSISAVKIGIKKSDKEYC